MALGKNPENVESLRIYSSLEALENSGTQAHKPPCPKSMAFGYKTIVKPRLFSPTPHLRCLGQVTLHYFYRLRSFLHILRTETGSLRFPNKTR